MKTQWIFVVGLIVVILLVVSTAETYRPAPVSHSSRNKNPEGCLALYLLLERYTNVERLNIPVSNLQSGTLLMIEPVIPLSSQEVSYLYHWVGEGNRLIVFSTNPKIMERFQVELTSSERISAVLPPLRNHWLTRNVDSVQVEYTRYFRFHQSCALFAHEERPIIIELKRKDGMIILASTPSLVENLNIGLEDNEIFIVNVALSERVYFDEYHLHSHPEPGEKKQGSYNLGAVFSSSYAPFFVQLILAVALFLIAYGKRIGAVRPPPHEKIQSSELVVSAADLYLKAGKEEVLQILKKERIAIRGEKHGKRYG